MRDAFLRVILFITFSSMLFAQDSSWGKFVLREVELTSQSRLTEDFYLVELNDSHTGYHFKNINVIRKISDKILIVHSHGDFSGVKKAYYVNDLWKLSPNIIGPVNGVKRFVVKSTNPETTMKLIDSGYEPVLKGD
ncbi:hypothetical protein [Mangrovivirga cuniculi]|uniref:Uncharacterized protein n=1 Tax=Mangrovivirga cuniculi TaxID=2715131 RepID=A0A4D7JHQ1_9BACT|nr:hypothetical protein [Mangrovivirga cuniculi]QCK15559.1 hypothetical protein DCC35_12775 [Mangrovivirga cuniculi]